MPKAVVLPFQKPKTHQEHITAQVLEVLHQTTGDEWHETEKFHPKDIAFFAQKMPKDWRQVLLRLHVRHIFISIQIVAFAVVLTCCAIVFLLGASACLTDYFVSYVREQGVGVGIAFIFAGALAVCLLMHHLMRYIPHIFWRKCDRGECMPVVNAFMDACTGVYPTYVEVQLWVLQEERALGIVTVAMQEEQKPQTVYVERTP